jgi:hypothetical protein
VVIIGQREPFSDHCVTVPFLMYMAGRRGLFSYLLNEFYDPGRGDSEKIERATFAAACACAYLGMFEDAAAGEFPGARTRQERLDFVAQYLPPRKFEVVMAVAVPQHYREMPALELEKLARSGTAEDRIWSACWLGLCGWLHSHDCTLLGTDELERVERLEASVREMIADYDEYRRLADRMWTGVEMYNLNGPPPLGIARATLGSGRYGWVELTQLVPAHLLAGDRSRRNDPQPPG